MTDEQKTDYIQALIAEQKAAEARVAADDFRKDEYEGVVTAVKAELKRVGHKAETPAKRAQTR